MSDEPNQTPYPAAAPPTQPGALPVAAPVTKWPTVLGVIGIIFGVFGILGSAWGVISLWVLPEMMQGGPPGAAAAMENVASYTIVLNALGLPVAVLLLVGAIGLVSRRRWSISLMKIWAVLRMLVGATGTLVAVRMQEEFLQGASMGGTSAGMVRTMQLVELVLGLVWACTLPTVVLIWLSRAKIKADVAGWR